MSTPKLPTDAPPPLRSELLATAVRFLSDPAVASAPLSRRLAFLEQKGLTAGEIEMALAQAAGSATEAPKERTLMTQQQQKPFNWRGLAVGASALVAGGLLIYQNLDFLKTLVKRPEASTDDEVQSKLTKLEEQQEVLKSALQELRQELDGREGAITGRLMELAQEIRELKK